MEIKNKIKEYLEKETQRKIESETENLIEAGVLDSFSMIKLIAYIESELKIPVKMEDLSPDNFNSIVSISKTIESHGKKR
ncbi:MAG: hypothetical protein G01um10143_140 [Parcubacteria group bacterium Gr01-1014_3]|nr:MAG: hypothetical protein G01um10143_140 [Parcubacteria group bacterium Gr01-1014_3]